MSNSRVEIFRFTVELLAVPFLISVLLAGLGVLLGKHSVTKDLGVYLIFVPTGAVAFSLLTAIAVGMVGIGWLDANPEMSLGNDGPGLIVAAAYFAAHPLGGIIGLVVGAVQARRVLRR